MKYQEIYDLYMKPYAGDVAIKARIEQGIEKNRKGNCNIRLLDRYGNPISNTKVCLNQISHEFRYGANMLMLDEFGDEQTNLAYRDTFYKYFNIGTVPFYWSTLEPERGKPRYAADSEKIYRRPPTDLCVDYCKEKGIDAKLHCLVYEAHVPDWLKDMSLDEVKAEYERHFAEIAERYADTLFEVEVINEVLLSPEWKKTSPLANAPDMIPWAFELARRYFPNSTLVFNEGQRWDSIGKNKRLDAYPLLLENAILKGADINKIGMQSHIFVGAGAQTPEQYDAELIKWMEFGNANNMFTSLDTLAQFGLPLEITEITIPTFGEGEEYEDLQAQMLRLWYSIFFSHPSVNTAVYWNTVDGYCYAPSPEHDENRCRGGLFHKDLSPKKSALMLKHLFDEEWHTEATLYTDEDGYLSFRGFLGNYSLSANGLNTIVSLKLAENDLTVTLK